VYIDKKKVMEEQQLEHIFLKNMMNYYTVKGFNLEIIKMIQSIEFLAIQIMDLELHKIISNSIVI